MRSPTSGIHDLRSVNNDDNETIIPAQPEFEVIMAPSPVKWPVVAWCIKDNGEFIKAVPITTDNEINFHVTEGIITRCAIRTGLAASLTVNSSPMQRRQKVCANRTR